MNNRSRDVRTGPIGREGDTVDTMSRVVRVAQTEGYVLNVRNNRGKLWGGRELLVVERKKLIYISHRGSAAPPGPDIPPETFNDVSHLLRIIGMVADAI